MDRDLRICASDKATCPRCKQLIRRIHPNPGSFLLTCGNDPAYRGAIQGKPRDAHRAGARCGKHLHVLGTTEGLCIVVGLTGDEFEMARNRTAKDIYGLLGIIDA